jgi:hypothetical protein
MSLGMIVAIVSAIRVSWKDDGNKRDELYIFRNGLSQIWYSSEITGTIIVQCIPILRPILREIHTALTSKRLSSTTDGGSATLGSILSGKRASVSAKRASFGANRSSVGATNDLAIKVNERIVLKEIPEESIDPQSRGEVSSSPSDASRETDWFSRFDMWPLSGNEGYRIWGYQSDKDSETEQDAEFGLSAPPRRSAHGSIGPL